MTVTQEQTQATPDVEQTAQAETTEATQQPETPEVTPEQRIAELEAKAAENYDLYVRALAEMENIRRRAKEDVQKAHKFSIESFAEQLLPVVDSLEKALEVAKADADHPLYEGMLVTYRQLVHSLDVAGMKAIDNSEDRTFDPHKHQAVVMVPAPEGVQAGQIVEVFQKGWMIHDRVLRPAMVSVAQG